ncbi:MAG: hypothetical protein KC582_01690 [Candidatus Magasanikbacteria bacterium]|nr:hypothetical protein [Candidatus Magasanikbacteria bacterium]USN52091.1 MAG: hypothetical protein H6759_03590 [Candidatus Nomurabacteria bacterium]
MEKFYFTKEGFARILDERERVIKKLRDAQFQKGEASETGGNQWHDNFAFEDLCRQEDQLNNQLGKIGELIKNALVFEEVSEDLTHLSIGQIAVLDVDGTRKEFFVGGYGDSDMKTFPQVVSYLAPMVKPFIGMSIGAEAEVFVAGSCKTVTLIGIRGVK